MSRKLVHYLRNERRLHYLTQADVAALLGGTWKSRVAKYERGVIPPTNVALEYQAILGKPVSELLGGAYERARSDVRRRAHELLMRDDAGNTPRRLRRRRSLERIAA